MLPYVGLALSFILSPNYNGGQGATFYTSHQKAMMVSRRLCVMVFTSNL